MLAAAEDPPTGLRRQVEAEHLPVVFGDLPGEVGVPVFLGQPGDLVLEDIGEALQEQERQQVVLELGRVLLAPDGTGGPPQHLLHRPGGPGRGPHRARPPPLPDDPRHRLPRRRPRLARSHPALLGQRLDGQPRRPLRTRVAPFPPVHGGERHPEPVGQLLLGQVERRPDRADGGGGILLRHV